MQQIRQLIYRVYAISILSENKVTLYEDTSLSSAEAFALSFDGGDKEIFIEKVYRLVRQPRGNEL